MVIYSCECCCCEQLTHAYMVVQSIRHYSDCYGEYNPLCIKFMDILELVGKNIDILWGICHFYGT